MENDGKIKISELSLTTSLMWTTRTNAVRAGCRPPSSSSVDVVEVRDALTEDGAPHLRRHEVPMEDADGGRRAAAPLVEDTRARVRHLLRGPVIDEVAGDADSLR